ncbi:hypothetical protein [Arthrobacter sp. IK3]|uniref:hypothetical protein n=1 Tax=Arthrobacter sp. IK3 TaxID=3448169 RepID=UPI003EE3DA0C
MESALITAGILVAVIAVTVPVYRIVKRNSDKSRQRGAYAPGPSAGTARNSPSSSGADNDAWFAAMIAGFGTSAASYNQDSGTRSSDHHSSGHSSYDSGSSWSDSGSVSVD